MTLGEKIRRCRLEQHLTQAELVGERLTRNMLSQIEKGKSVPSLPVLIYLAETLNMPLGYFFCAEEEEFFYHKAKIFPRLKDLYRAGSYAECLRLFEKELGECDDELGLMMASCSFALGRAAWQTGALTTAAAHLAGAMEYAAETVYPTDYIRAGGGLLLSIANNIQSPLLEFNEPAYVDSLRRAGCLDEYYYLMGKTEDYVFDNPFYAAHLSARTLIKERRYTEALAALCEIEEKKGDPRLTAFLLFRLYGDMEICYREDRNFEEAYRYSTKRVSMLAAFRS